MKFYGSRELLMTAIALAGYGYEEKDGAFALTGGTTVRWNPETADLTAEGGNVERLRERLAGLGTDRREARNVAMQRFRRAFEP